MTKIPMNRTDPSIPDKDQLVRILEIGMANCAQRALCAALKKNLFGRIPGEGIAPGEMSAILECRERPARIMTDMLVSLGLLRREDELHATIGRNIRQLRKERSLTLKQMARRTKLSVSLLSQIERAESSASVSSLFKVATALDVKITDLFGDY